MTNFNKMLLVAGATMLFASPALAAPGSSSAKSATANTKAQIVEPLTLTKVQDLDFATIVKTPAMVAGVTTTLTLADDGSLSGCAPASGLICTGTTAAARFKATGTAGQLVYVYTNASETMVNGNFDVLVFTPNQAVPNATLSLTTSDVTFGVGGSIPVTTLTPPGTYAGTMQVTADYN